MPFEPIETQEAFDAAIKDRIERAKSTVRSEYTDYEELKSKAAKYDEAEAANKTELEKAQEEVERLRADVKKRDEAAKLTAAKAKVSKETGVPAELISGTTEEEMAASAKAIAEYAKKPSAPSLSEAGKKPEESNGEKDGYRQIAQMIFGEQ